MYQQGRRNILDGIPPAVKGLLIINTAMYVITFLYDNATGGRLADILGLHYPASDLFQPFQIITHMFMHGGLMHLAFNMYALWMFGQYIEQRMGTKRFFIYYIVTGLGAAALHTFVIHLQVNALTAEMPKESINLVLSEGAKIWANGQNYQDLQLGNLNALINVPTVGASGAVFGILLAFGMLFPNVELQLFFIPIPIKAKYFVMGYGALELINGITNTPGDNIAHFAHLGGMIFGFILMKIWKSHQQY